MNTVTFWIFFVRKQVAVLKTYDPKQQVGFFFSPHAGVVNCLHQNKGFKIKTEINLELYLGNSIY